MTGVMDEREMKYSIAAVRSGKVQESARRFRNKSGVVEWHQQMKFTTRLPGQGNVGADFVTFTLVEFLPEGSTSEALPFDVDILAMACKPGQYVISPCKDASLRISIHARTVKLRPKRAKANPLCTAKQIRTEKHIDIPYGPSSDEED
ncbi:hypothetical protein DIPPA_09297 [Diplonema papillatum]|nr:hypothetical protein DIPPA_09297 [Diplonema papillatum]